ncbi:MAG TPA: hypothetical protein VFV39_09655, partial [Limnobacter sp.]|nr:hypothetical protein [Limnobacter sp.]
MNSVTTATIQSELMCNLPNGEVLYSASFTRAAGLMAVCSLIKLQTAERKFLAAVGGHVPDLFGSVPGQVCAKFQGLNIADGNYVLELQFADGATLLTPVTYSKAFKSSSPKALKHFAQVGMAVDAMMNRSNHPAAVVVAPAPAPAPAKAASTVTPKPPAVKQPAVQLPAYNYHVDGIIGGVVEGWVWCPHHPERRYEVQAWCANRLVGYGVANIYREDLARAGKSDGKIKFELNLARHLYDGKTHNLQIKVVGQGDLDCDKLIHGGLVYEAPIRPQRPELLESLPSYLQSVGTAKKFVLMLAEKGMQWNIHKILHHIYNAEPRPARRIINEILSAGFEH